MHFIVFQVIKKLAGTARGTALWLSSVGNEYGEILISVLTAQEGAGLDRMAEDLVRRYQLADVDPPVILYVDCGCCAKAERTTKLEVRFGGWPDLIIRLDIWHLMRRLAIACTTEAHQLYAFFMSRLSACIFEWDAADLALLRQAKAQQLRTKGLPTANVDRHIRRNELALHCRRRTRGEAVTVQLLEELLTSLKGSQGNDSLGVPLFDRERLEEAWRVQRKHIKCIQDPPGVALYTKTGELTKGGLRLPVYRCARGSTSLESFHLHLARFIPGLCLSEVSVMCSPRLSQWDVSFIIFQCTSRDQCQQPELSDIPVGRAAQVEPGPACRCPGHRAICAAELLWGPAALCQQKFPNAVWQKGGTRVLSTLALHR